MNKKFLLVIIFVIAFSIISACTQKETGKKQKEATGFILPKEVTEIEISLEEIIKLLGGPFAQTREEVVRQRQLKKTPKKMDVEKEETGESSSDNKSDKNSSKNQEKEDKSGSKKDNQEEKQALEGVNKKEEETKEKTPEEKYNLFSILPMPTENDWTKISDITEKLHFTWNSLEPLLTEKKIDTEKLTSFTFYLNELTNTLETKDCLSSMFTAAVLYSYIPSFYSLFAQNLSPEIKKLKADTFSTIILSIQGQWNEAKIHIERMENTWSIFKNKFLEKHKEESEMLSFSINDLKNAVDKHNKLLTSIKGKLNLSNIKSLENALSE